MASRFCRMRNIYLLSSLGSSQHTSPRGWLSLYASMTLEIALVLLALVVCLTKSF